MQAQNGQKSIVKGLVASLAGGSFFAGLSIATSIGLLAKVTPTLVSPFGIIFDGAGQNWQLLTWVSFAIAAILLAVVPFILAKKVTDGEVVKAEFAKGAKVLWAVVALNGFLAIATILMSLFSLGIEGMSEKAASAMQKQYWLGTFVPVLVAALVNGVGAFFLGAIAKGKMALMNTFKIASIVIAGVAVVLMVVASLVTLHPKKGSDSNDVYNANSILKDLGL
ncbi:MAG: hypothetical protein LBM12_01855 [Candidatus Nomurabacteria bacterium]|jgi:MFS family permease|nr:hypothetical protein [Candidatus Nomurabacteria bacterium]